MIHTSYVMSVFDREPEVLYRVLSALAGQMREDEEIVIVDDGSRQRYEGVVEMARPTVKFSWLWHPTVVHVPAAYVMPEGQKNPAHVLNYGVRASFGIRIVLMSSDCEIGPGLLARLRSRDEREVWHARTVNRPGGEVYCGGARPAPFGWFLAMPRQRFEALGGYDERFCRGVGCEDADLLGRLILDGPITIDETVEVTHIAHPHRWFTDGQVGYGINKTYIREKWKGLIPFDRKMEATPHVVIENGDGTLTVRGLGPR